MAKLKHVLALRVEALGGSALRSLHGMGLCGMQFGEAVKQFFKPPFRMKMLVKQMEFIGNKSLGVCC